MKIWAALALLSAFLAMPALGADLEDCGKSGRDYAVLPGQQCFLICKGLTTSSGTACPVGRLPISEKGYHEIEIGIGNADAGCTIPAGGIVVGWIPRATATAPSVIHSVATLTGIGTSDTASYALPYLFGRYWTASFPALTDTDCNANGGVDIFLLVR